MADRDIQTAGAEWLAMLAMGMVAGIALRPHATDEQVLGVLEDVPGSDQLALMLANYEAKLERGEQSLFYVQALRDLIAFKASRDVARFREAFRVNNAINGRGRVRIATTTIIKDGEQLHVIKDDGSMPTAGEATP